MTPEISPPSPDSDFAKPAPQPAPDPTPQPQYQGPTWEDDETRTTGILRALFALLATGFLAYAQWHAPADWVGPIGQNWNRWVWTSVLFNFLLPLGIVWMFFGQGLGHQSWLKNQKHNAWSYGFGWFGTPHDLREADLPVGKLGRFSYVKLWHPMFWNADQTGRKVWKRRLGIALAAWAVMLPFLWFFSRDTAIRADYATYLPPVESARDWLWLVLTLVVYMFCWEWFFRGFALFGAAQGLGWIPAVIAQAAIFGLAHHGKPEVEMWSAFAGGLVLGTLSWREKSFFTAFLIHSLVHVSWAILVLI